MGPQDHTFSSQPANYLFKGRSANIFQRLNRTTYTPLVEPLRLQFVNDFTKSLPWMRRVRGRCKTTNKTGPRNASASGITLERAIGYRLLESRPGGCSADNFLAEPHEVKSTCKRCGLH